MKYKIVNIKEKPELLSEVITLGDSQKQTLGFLPEQAFIDYADRGSILLAVTEGNILIGYTLFAQKQNQVCRLAHVCVHPKWHKQGVGHALIAHLKEITSRMHRIIVKCRRDYGIDYFWETNGFVAKGEKPGRGQSDTTLTLWEYRHQLSLLSLPPEGIKPLAVLDLNVVIEASSNNNNECKILFSFTYSDEIDYRISIYSYTEVNRSNNKDNRQLTRGQLNSLSHLGRCPDPHIVQSILKIIGQSKIDDAEQIASAAYHNADYFITRDTGLTGHFKKIQVEFGLSIYTPTEFIINYCNGNGRDLYYPGYVTASEISFKPIIEFHISELFQNYKAPDEKKHCFEHKLSLNSPDIKNNYFLRILAKDLEIGICAQAKSNNCLNIRLLRLKNSIKHMHTLSVHIIENILQTSIVKGVNNITVTDNSSGRLVEQALIGAGFQQHEDRFIKPVQKGIIPIDEAMDKVGITSRGNSPPVDTNFIELENMLWPAKLAGLKIPIYIIPIRAKWAKNLISTAGHQLSLMGASNVMLQTRRVYYRSNQGVNISVPSRIIWYISENRQHGPSKSVIGVSLANEVKTAPANTLFKQYERFGVYAWKDILSTANNDPGKMLMAIVFSKTEIFHKPIPLNSVSKTIKKIENRTFNPVSPFAVSHKSFEEIYKLGTGYGQ